MWYAYFQFVTPMLRLAFIGYYRRLSFLNADGSIQKGEVIFYLAFCVLVIALLYRYVFYPLKRQDSLLKNGNKAKAKILQIEQKHLLGRRPLVAFLIEISLSSEIPYTVTIKAVVSAKYIHHFEIGQQIPIRINPKNKTDVIIEHKYVDPPYINLFAGRTQHLSNGINFKNNKK